MSCNRCNINPCCCTPNCGVPYQIPGQVTHNFKDLSGKSFGKLVVNKRVFSPIKQTVVYECRCACGKTINIRANHLRRANFTRSCGCIRKGGSKSNPEGVTAFNSVYGAYKSEAKTRNLLFFLTKDEFKEITKKNCNYCGQIPVNRTDTKKNHKKYGGNNGVYVYNGIDRLNNNIGYLPENCVPCCKHCNWMKRDLTYQEFTDHISKICTNLKNRKNELL